MQILDEINEQGIRIYQLPDADSDEDEEFKEQTRVLKVRGQSFQVHYQFCNTADLPKALTEVERVCLCAGQHPVRRHRLQPADRGEGEEDPWTLVPVGGGGGGKPRAQ